jgi:hypothetical protein
MACQAARLLLPNHPLCSKTAATKKRMHCWTPGTHASAPPSQIELLTSPCAVRALACGYLRMSSSPQDTRNPTTSQKRRGNDFLHHISVITISVEKTTLAIATTNTSARTARHDQRRQGTYRHCVLKSLARLLALNQNHAAQSEQLCSSPKPVVYSTVALPPRKKEHQRLDGA